MKLYIKIPTIEVFQNLHKLLPFKDSAIKTKINFSLETLGEIIDYKTNVLALEFLKEYFDGIPFTQNINGIYFGSETCENLLPNVSELQEVYEYCKANHINLALMTPPIINNMEFIEPLLDFIAQKDMELIVNDFGVFELVREMRLTNSVILGRLLLKRQKNPLMKLYEPSLDDARFHTTELSINEFGEFLKSFGISRGSVDGNYDFERETLEEKAFYKDYYFPYTYLSMMSRCNLCDVCERQCQSVNIHYNSYNKNKAIIQRTNGIYYINYNFSLSRDFVKKRRNRLVFELWG